MKTFWFLQTGGWLQWFCWNLSDSAIWLRNDRCYEVFGEIWWRRHSYRLWWTCNIKEDLVEGCMGLANTKGQSLRLIVISPNTVCFSQHTILTATTHSYGGKRVCSAQCSSSNVPNIKGTLWLWGVHNTAKNWKSPILIDELPAAADYEQLGKRSTQQPIGNRMVCGSSSRSCTETCWATAFIET